MRHVRDLCVGALIGVVVDDFEDSVADCRESFFLKPRVLGEPVRVSGRRVRQDDLGREVAEQLATVAVSVEARFGM